MTKIKIRLELLDWHLSMLLSKCCLVLLLSQSTIILVDLYVLLPSAINDAKEREKTRYFRLGDCSHSLAFAHDAIFTPLPSPLVLKLAPLTGAQRGGVGRSLVARTEMCVFVCERERVCVY